MQGECAFLFVFLTEKLECQSCEGKKITIEKLASVTVIGASPADLTLF